MHCLQTIKEKKEPNGFFISVEVLCAPSKHIPLTHRCPEVHRMPKCLLEIASIFISLCLKKGNPKTKTRCVSCQCQKKVPPHQTRGPAQPRLGVALLRRSHGKMPIYFFAGKGHTCTRVPSCTSTISFFFFLCLTSLKWAPS